MQNNYNQPYQPQNNNYTVSTVPKKETKNKFLTFVTALIPGAGAMYHGLMQKGVLLMSSFFAIILVSTMLYIPSICIALPIVWFYSFFETVNRMNYSIEELNAIKSTEIDFSHSEKFKNIFSGKGKIVGIALIIIGVYSLLYVLVLGNNALFINLLDARIYHYIYVFIRFLPKLLIPLICFFVGAKLIKSRKD